MNLQPIHNIDNIMCIYIYICYTSVYGIWMYMVDFL